MSFTLVLPPMFELIERRGQQVVAEQCRRRSEREPPAERGAEAAHAHAHTGGCHTFERERAVRLDLRTRRFGQAGFLASRAAPHLARFPPDGGSTAALIPQLAGPTGPLPSIVRDVC